MSNTRRRLTRTITLTLFILIFCLSLLAFQGSLFAYTGDYYYWYEFTEIGEDSTITTDDSDTDKVSWTDSGSGYEINWTYYEETNQYADGSFDYYFWLEGNGTIENITKEDTYKIEESDFASGNTPTGWYQYWWEILQKLSIHRDHQMECVEVWVNDNNNFEFIFTWEYADNNNVKFYKAIPNPEASAVADGPNSNENLANYLPGEMVKEVKFALGKNQFEVDIPNGMYIVMTFHTDPTQPIQAFLVGK